MTFLSPQTNILSSSYFLIQNPDLITTIAAAQIMICQAAQVLGDLISVSLPLLKPVQVQACSTSSKTCHVCPFAGIGSDTAFGGGGGGLAGQR